MTQTTLTEVLTLEEIAAYLRLAPDVVAAQAAAGTLPGRQIGGQWRFLRSAVDAWLRAHDRRDVLLQQAGALADDETLDALRASIYAQRGRPEAEPDA